MSAPAASARSVLGRSALGRSVFGRSVFGRFAFARSAFVRVRISRRRGGARDRYRWESAPAVHGLMLAEMGLTMWPGAAPMTEVAGAGGLLLTAGLIARRSAGGHSSVTSTAESGAAARAGFHWILVVDLVTMALVQLAMLGAAAVLGADSRTVSLAGLVVAAGWPAARCWADSCRQHWRSGVLTGVALLAMIAICP